MAEKNINCISAPPTLLHTNPVVSGPENYFSAQNKKNQNIHDFRPKKGGGHFLPPPPFMTPQKSGFQVGGGGLGGGYGPKTHWGMRLLDKIMILQGVKATIEPHGVGYANRPKKAQNRGVCGSFPHIRACLALI